METSQRVETVLLQEAEAEVRTLLQSLQTLREGDLKSLEQQIIWRESLGVTGEILQI